MRCCTVSSSRDGRRARRALGGVAEGRAEVEASVVLRFGGLRFVLILVDVLFGLLDRGEERRRRREVHLEPAEVVFFISGGAVPG
jgi:hypothetical protein